MPTPDPFARIQLLQGDITRLNVDAIVNAANSRLAGGGGVDGAIHRAAGATDLQNACRQLAGCNTGDAKITPGFNLPAQYIIHTVGPVWSGGNHDEPRLLASCYTRSLELALQHNIASIAFPAISTGVYGFPFEQATEIALRTVTAFLSETDAIQKVILIFFAPDQHATAERIHQRLAKT